MKKILVVGIVILFMFGSIIPSVVSQPLHGKHIITVDDEPGDADFTSIKEAVNSASSGDIIEVFSGTYSDVNISISKPNLTIIGLPYELGSGNDTGKPTIEILTEYYNVFIVQTYNISISGFKIIAKVNYSRVLSISHVSHFLFSNNEIFGASLAYVVESDHLIFSNNTIEGGYSHLDIFDSHYILITNSTFRNAGYCMTLSYDNDVTISHNIIDHGGEAIHIGEGSKINITENRIINSYDGVELHGKNHLLVDRNEFRNDTTAVDVEWVSALTTRVTHNNFMNNGLNVFILGCPLLLSNLIFQKNYYGRPHYLPKPFLGFFLIPIIGGDMFFGIPIPWFCFDWHPAKQPYNITTGGFQ